MLVLPSCRCPAVSLRAGAVPYLFADERAWQGHNRPEENATAQDDLSVEAVAQVTEDRSSHHEAADEDWGEKKRKCYIDYSIEAGNAWIWHVFFTVFRFVGLYKVQASY